TTPAAKATRIVRSVPPMGSAARGGGQVEGLGQELPDAGQAGGELEPPVTELDDWDRRHERALPGFVGVDVALDERRGGEAGGRPIGQQVDEGAARVVAQVTARAGVQVELVHRSAILVRERFEPAGRYLGRRPASKQVAAGRGG